MPHFDYKIVVLAHNKELIQEELCNLGEEGWELVTVDFDARRYIFKKIRYHKKDQNSNFTEEERKDIV